MSRVDLLWSSTELHSTEHFVLTERATSSTLAGVAVLDGGGVPGHATYRLEVDATWRTRDAEIEVVGARDVHLRIEVDDARWTIDGLLRDELEGCLDVDLGWTPATNLLPIRRLGLEIGEIGRLDAAWLRYPELDIVRSTQEYERVDEAAYVYRSAGFEALLHTTSDGIVTRYGDDLWFATSLVRS